jgi:hypothetical protein
VRFDSFAAGHPTTELALFPLLPSSRRVAITEVSKHLRNHRLEVV